MPIGVLHSDPDLTPMWVELAAQLHVLQLQIQKLAHRHELSVSALPGWGGQSDAAFAEEETAEGALDGAV